MRDDDVQADDGPSPFVDRLTVPAFGRLEAFGGAQMCRRCSQSAPATARSIMQNG